MQSLIYTAHGFRIVAIIATLSLIFGGLPANSAMVAVVAIGLAGLIYLICDLQVKRGFFALELCAYLLWAFTGKVSGEITSDLGVVAIWLNGLFGDFTESCG